MLIQATKPQLPPLPQSNLAPHRGCRGSQRTPRHRAPQAPRHVLTPGEELEGCSLFKNLKALEGQCCHTRIVHLPTTRCERSQYLLHFTPPSGTREFPLFILCHPPHARTVHSHDPDQAFPYQQTSPAHLGGLVWATQTCQT